ncbi:MAG: AAA family ATPase [Proteobacteria bacterium]|nr:AAA family ATPase [Pseudomonadota bacterium]
MIDLHSIKRRYGGDISGNTVKIPTPGHSRRDRGTSITLAPDAPDRCLVHCFNDYDPLAIKDMLRRDGFLPPREQSRSYQAQPHIDVEALVRKAEQAPEIADDWQDKMCWDYTDAEGKVLYRKRRVNKPDGSKSFIFENKGDQDHVLYRLPDLIAGEGPVFVAEGEKCADKLASWGLAATSSKDLDKCDLSFLKGRTAFILPDNDEVGAKIAQKAIKALKTAGAYPLTVKLPDLPEKGDIMDWKGSREDLIKLAGAAYDQTEPTIKATPFQWRDPASIPTRPWLFGQWLLQGTVASLIAPGGSGKSTFISALALSIASGQEFLGQEVHDGPQNVWIWNLEDDLDELSRSILATAKHHNLDTQLLEQRLFVDSGLDGAGLCTAIETKDGVKICEPVYDALKEELIRRDIAILSVDPFVSSHKVNENDNRAIDEVAKEWARVAKAANCCIMLSHHTNKEGSHKVTTLSSRGASSLTNAARSALVINRLDPNDAPKFGIEPHEARQYINVGDDKHNRAPAAKADWFKIVSVDLGNGMLVELETMGPFTVGSDSVGVIEPTNLSEAAQQVEPELIGQVQEMIAVGPYNRENAQAKNWAGHAVAEVLGLCASADRVKIKALLSQWVTKGYLRAVKKPDLETRKPNVPFFEVGRQPQAEHESESAPPIM